MQKCRKNVFARKRDVLESQASAEKRCGSSGITLRPCICHQTNVVLVLEFATELFEHFLQGSLGCRGTPVLVCLPGEGLDGAAALPAAGPVRNHL